MSETTIEETQDSQIKPVIELFNKSNIRDRMDFYKKVQRF